jgi:hypothetical protein
VSQNGQLLSRRGRSLTANASGFDTHCDSISSRSDCRAAAKQRRRAQKMLKQQQQEQQEQQATAGARGGGTELALAALPTGAAPSPSPSPAPASRKRRKAEERRAGVFRVLSSGLIISRGVEEVSERVGTLGPAGTLVHISSVQVGGGRLALLDGSQSCAPWGGGRLRACAGVGGGSRAPLPPCVRDGWRGRAGGATHRRPDRRRQLDDRHAAALARPAGGRASQRRGGGLGPAQQRQGRAAAAACARAAQRRRAGARAGAGVRARERA